MSGPPAPAPVALGSDAAVLGAEYVMDFVDTSAGRYLLALASYIGLGYFKLAVISERIAARYQQGQTVSEGFDKVLAVVPGLFESAPGALESI